jgi:tRNA (guanine-N7-)-methyltransferase
VPKKKLIHFTENLSFPHLFQPRYQELLPEFRLKGRWGAEFFRNDHPITLELGCGKGEYTVALARKYSERNFIGIDIKGARLWRGSKTVAEERLQNAAFIRSHVNNLPLLFGPGEVAELWITFPDPQPKHERKRLTSPAFVSRYRKVLPPGGVVHLKTDNPEFYRYTLDVIRGLSLQQIWATEDLYGSGTIHDVASVRTFYEEKWLELNKKIMYIRFVIP